MALRRRLITSVSNAIGRNPGFVHRVQKGWIGFGAKFLDLRIASWVIRRPEWLAARSSAHFTTLEPRLPSPPNMSIAKRIIDHFNASAPKEGQYEDKSIQETYWGTARQVQYGELTSIIESGDMDRLAMYQSSLFRTQTVNGYSYGDMFDIAPHRWHYLPVAIELSVVTLAESLGILRAECHEQGQTAYWRAAFTENELMVRLETALGVRIDAPRFGDPRGILFGGRFLTRETCSHLHSAYRMRDLIRRAGVSDPLTIVEIGGGYGGTCYWLRKLIGDAVHRYVIVDLPEVSVVQAFFLGSADPESLILSGEPRGGIASSVELVPHYAIEALGIRPNVVINQDSMPEMPASEVDRYLAWANGNLRGVFLSFNQEALSPLQGTLQVHVPTALQSFPAFTRISRETSWDRRGYVEEAYTRLDQTA